MTSKILFFALPACLGLILTSQGVLALEPPELEELEALMVAPPDFPELPELLTEPPSLEEILGEAATPVPPLPEELLLFLSGGQVGPPAADETAVLMPAGDISLFSHTFHVEQAGYSCSDCHDSIFQQMQGAAKAAGDFNKASFAEGKYCGFCHDGTTAFAIVEENSCSRCHQEEVKIPDVLIFDHPVQPVYYDHSLHLHLGFSCNDCHESLFAMQRGHAEQQPDFMMDSVQQGKYCGSCHNGATAFALDSRCVQCHREMQEDAPLKKEEQK